MKSQPRFVARFAGPVSVLLALAGCSGSGSDPGAEDAPPPKPEVGQCYNLDRGAQEAASLPTDTVDCAKPHTVLVTAVVKTPSKAKMTGSRNGPVFEYAYDRCRPAKVEAVGGDAAYQAMFLYDWTFWGPNGDQRKDGADWIACGVVASDRDQTIDLPQTTPFLDNGGAEERFVRCLGASRKVGDAQISCSRAHTLQAFVSYTAKGAWQEGRDTETGDFARTCRKLLAQPPKWGWTTTRSDVFDLGDKSVVCYAPLPSFVPPRQEPLSDRSA